MFAFGRPEAIYAAFFALKMRPCNIWVENINTDKIEIELIDYITGYLTSGFKKELNEFEKAVLNDFEPYQGLLKEDETTKTI